MRQVLLIGGQRDGDRVSVSDDYTDRVYLPGRFIAAEFYSSYTATPQEVSYCAHCVYKLERFRTGRTTMWVGYPVGTSPEHCLTMLMAGYVGNS